VVSNCHFLRSRRHSSSALFTYTTLFRSMNDAVVGYAGDWSQLVWGTVGGISFDVSTEAAVTLNGSLVSLWEQNLVAIRAEAEFGCFINGVENFVTFTDTPAS